MIKLLATKATIYREILLRAQIYAKKSYARMAQVPINRAFAHIVWRSIWDYNSGRAVSPEACVQSYSCHTVKNWHQKNVTSFDVY